jgi:putative endonuclease
MIKGATNLAGARAEEAAMRHLSRAGLVPLVRNWRCRHGEIDLIARDGDTVVFVEVRMRRGPGLFGGAAESITFAKRSRLLAAARLFLSRMREAPCRFDVMLMDEADGERIEWIRDAFSE